MIQKALEVQNQAGLATDAALAAQRVIVYSATAAHLDAQLAADQAAAKKQDMHDKMNLTKVSVSDHIASLITIKISLAVYSPVAGQFTSTVAAGWFVKKGHILGHIV